MALSENAFVDEIRRRQRLRWLFPNGIPEQLLSKSQMQQPKPNKDIYKKNSCTIDHSLAFPPPQFTEIPNDVNTFSELFFLRPRLDLTNEVSATS